MSDFRVNIDNYGNDVPAFSVELSRASSTLSQRQTQGDIARWNVDVLCLGTPMRLCHRDTLENSIKDLEEARAAIQKAIDKLKFYKEDTT